jgi:uncharacterized membrane protein YgdD (TMEM256/DUF423 family)
MPLLFLLFATGTIFGIAVLSKAQSAIHEIAGLLMFIGAVIALVGGLVCARLDKLITRNTPPADKP